MEMAQQQAPPAALAPIAVVVDEVQINSDAMLVLAPGAQHVRDHTSFLNWATVYNGAAAVVSYTLGQSDAKGAFLPRGARSRGLPAGKDPPRPSQNCYLAERGGAA